MGMKRDFFTFFLHEKLSDKNNFTIKIDSLKDGIKSICDANILFFSNSRSHKNNTKKLKKQALY